MGCGASKSQAIGDVGGASSLKKMNSKKSHVTGDTSFRIALEGERYPHVEEFRKKYDIVRCIGSGKYGAVHLVCRKADGKHFAVKAIRRPEDEGRPSNAGRRGPPEEIQNEIELLSKLKHSNILSIRGVYEEDEGFVLLLDYSAGGDLYRALKKAHKGVWSEKRAAKTLIDVLCGLCFLHSQHIAHRDLKPENVLLSRSPAKESLPPCDDRGVSSAAKQMEQLDLNSAERAEHSDEHIPVVLADFGFAKKSSSSDPLKTFCGSPLYIAPEIIRSRYGLYHSCYNVDGEVRGKDKCRHCLADASGTVTSVPKEERRPYTPLCDVWSAGILLFEVLYGYTPFAAKGSNGTLRNVLKGKFEFPDLPGAKARISTQGHIPMKKLLLNIKTSEEAKDVISKMLSYEPDDRCTAAEALAHRWFGQEGVAEYRYEKVRELLESLRKVEGDTFTRSQMAALEQILVRKNVAKESEADDSARRDYKESSLETGSKLMVSGSTSVGLPSTHRRTGQAFLDSSGSMVLSKRPASREGNTTTVSKLPDVSDSGVTRVKVKNGGITQTIAQSHSNISVDNPPTNIDRSQDFSMSGQTFERSQKIAMGVPPIPSGPQHDELKRGFMNQGFENNEACKDGQEVPFDGFLAPIGTGLSDSF